jgi:hypothetical protein
MIIITITLCGIFTTARNIWSQTVVRFDPMSIYARAHHTNPRAKWNCILLSDDTLTLPEYNSNNIRPVRKEVCIVYLLWEGGWDIVSKWRIQLSIIRKLLYTVMDLLGALLGGGPGGRVLAHAPRNSTVEVFPSYSRMYHGYTTHAQVTSHKCVRITCVPVIRSDVTQRYDECLSLVNRQPSGKHSFSTIQQKRCFLQDLCRVLMWIPKLGAVESTRTRMEHVPNELWRTEKYKVSGDWRETRSDWRLNWRTESS